MVATIDMTYSRGWIKGLEFELNYNKVYDDLYVGLEDIRIFSNNKNGCKVSHIAKNNNFNQKKLFNFGKYKKRQSTFGGVVDSDIHYLRNISSSWHS